MQGFNLLLLQLHGEISLSLLWSHSPWGLALVLAPPLGVGRTQTSVPCTGKRVRKQWLIRAHLLTQAGEREGYGSHNWDVQGVPAVAEASVKLQEPEVCCAFSRGSWPQSQDPRQWWAPQAAGKVWAVTCLAHRTLGSSGGRQPLGSNVTATACACAHVGVALLSVSV